jgi:hypothetical protein
MPIPPNAEQARQALDEIVGCVGSFPLDAVDTLRQFIENAAADIARLDSGCIMTHDQDEWTDEIIGCERRGMNLRAAIDEALAAASRTPQPGQEG